MENFMEPTVEIISVDEQLLCTNVGIGSGTVKQGEED